MALVRYYIYVTESIPLPKRKWEQTLGLNRFFLAVNVADIGHSHF